jgi:type I restriction enzyme S subunit
MSKYTKVKLREVSDISLGKMLNKETNRGELQPYLANFNVQWGNFDLSEINQTRFEAGEADRFGLRRGDIVMCEGGEPGRCAIWKNELPNMRFQKALHRLRVKENFSSEYLYYRFLLAGWLNEFERHFIGSTIKHLTGVMLREIEFEFPPFIEQKKIATVLSVLDSKIEVNNRINRVLEALARTIYNYWFVQFDFPDENGRPYRSSGGSMTYNERLKRQVPTGWEVVELSDCLDLIIDHRGKTPKKLGGDWANADDSEGAVIALSARHVKNNELIDLDQANKVGREMFEKWMPHKLSQGDILMTSEAPLGEFYFFVEEDEYCLSQRLFAMRPDKSKVASTYLFFELSRGNGRSQILGGQSGSTVFGIRQDELRKVLVMKPDFGIQTKFHEKVLPMAMAIRANGSQNRQLAALRDWLLPMLMNGQITVS